MHNKIPESKIKSIRHGRGKITTLDENPQLQETSSQFPLRSKTART